MEKEFMNKDADDFEDDESEEVKRTPLPHMRDNDNVAGSDT